MLISSLVSVTLGFKSFFKQQTEDGRMLFTLLPPSARKDLLL